MLMNQFTNFLIYYSVVGIIIGIFIWNFIIYPSMVRAVIEGVTEFEKGKNLGSRPSSKSDFSDFKKREIDRDYGDGIGIYVILAVVIIAMAIAFFTYG